MITQSSGYMPPEYVERGEISKKFDIFSLGVIMIKIVSGPAGYSECSDMASEEFVDQVHERWRNILQATWTDSSLCMYCEQVKRCTRIALKCIERNRHQRPKIKDIISELNGKQSWLRSLEIETRLHMYLHQFPAWPNVPNRNEYPVISSPERIGFGQMYVHDWVLTEGPSATENVVGSAQGFHLQAGQTTSSWYTAHTFVFRDGSSAGSTLVVSGITEDKPEGQWSITGGTVAFASAHGTIKFINSESSTATDCIKELDIHVFHTPEPAN